MTRAWQPPTRRGESFSKVIDRLLSKAAVAHTGADLLRKMEDLPPLRPEDARVFLDVVDEDRVRGQRTTEEWMPQERAG